MKTTMSTARTTRWMGATDRAMKMVNGKERWRTTDDDGEEPSMTIAGTPDDGTSLKIKKSHTCR